MVSLRRGRLVATLVKERGQEITLVPDILLAMERIPVRKMQLVPERNVRHTFHRPV